MSEQDPTSIRMPRADDRQLLDIEVGLVGYMAIFVAHKLKLFSHLGRAPHTLVEVCQALNLARRPAEALLNVSRSLGLVHKQGESYTLTPLAEDYLLDTSPTYFGDVLDLDLADPPSFASLEKAVLANAQQVYGGGDWVKSHEERADLARAFTRAMHGYGMGPALAWPDMLDLSEHRLMLDIGGGSGVHSIGAVRRWPNLQAITFDLAPVCEVAQEFVSRYGLQSRIRTHVGDMWQDPFPSADLHVYANIYHDWPVEKGRVLSRKSFESLKPGGRILLHEMLYDDNKAGPFTVAAFNILMLFATEGEQYSGSELATLLTEAGFTEIDVKHTFGYWSIVTGRKPG
jgi:SAM-dependent methyltransferase